ncbi:unnamed protein product [Lampetra planeri]
MALDDNSLAAFFTIPKSDRITLARAYTEMAGIFDPPSNVQRRFSMRRRGENETPLAYRSTLLALGHAAFPRMDRVALDSLTLERLLSLARELGVTLSVAEEDDPTSLQVARGIQAHLNLKDWPAVAASAMEPAVDEQACTSSARGMEGRSGGLRSSAREWHPRLSQPPGRPYHTCYRCGCPGHIAVDCRRGTGGFPPHLSSGFNTSSSHKIQVSPTVSDTLPFLSHHPSSIGRAWTHPVESHPVATQKQDAGSLAVSSSGTHWLIT